MSSSSGLHNGQKCSVPAGCDLCSSHNGVVCDIALMGTKPPKNKKIIQEESGAAPPVKKRFQCTFCDYSAERKGYIVSHERTHTGERPYPCPHCSYAAAQIKDRTHHIQAHHVTIEPVKCEFPGCPKVFKTRVAMKQHHKRIHFVHNNAAPVDLNISHPRAAVDPAPQTTVAASAANNAPAPMTFIMEKLSEDDEAVEVVITFACDKCDFVTDRDETLLAHRALHFGQEHEDIPQGPTGDFSWTEGDYIYTSI